MEQPRTITLDGTTYEVTQFSAAVQQAVGVYNTFAAELQKEQLAVIKTQAAIQQLSGQIAEAVKKELAEKAEAPVAPVAAE